VHRIIENKDPTLRPSLTKGRVGEGSEERGPNILIDINGFQKKHIENVRAVAHMMSERARYFKSNIEVDPMSAFERRIVHEFLSDATDLKTESAGMGPTRHVVIKYIGTI
jgi:spoIIIJ-associated protein